VAKTLARSFSPTRHRRKRNPEAKVQRLEISLKTFKLRHRKVQIDRDVKYYRRKFTNILQDMAMDTVLNLMKGRL
jgi:hypothetical protein